MKPLKNARVWARLRLLCQSGLPAISLAPELLRLTRQLVPNAAGALFLTDPQGVPHSFFHEDSPAESRALFQNQFPLFMQADDINIVQLVGQNLPAGTLLHPPPGYFRSNTYQLLVRASGHHHALDAPLHLDGLGMGALMLFREPGARFKAHDLVELVRVSRQLSLALGADPLPEPAWAHLGDEALLVLHPHGQPLWINPQAQALLARLPQQANGWRPGQHLPPALSPLLQALRQGDSLPRLRLPVPGGWLLAQAQWLGACGPGDAAGGPAPADAPAGAAPHEVAPLVGVSLRLGVPQSLQVWRAVAGADLSPRQLEVALGLAQGHSNASLRARLNLSEAVLRDCARAVYREFDVSSQAGLAQRLMAAAA